MSEIGEYVTNVKIHDDTKEVLHKFKIKVINRPPYFDGNL